MLRCANPPNHSAALREGTAHDPGRRGCVRAPLTLGTSRTFLANPRYSLGAVPENYRQRMSPRRVRMECELGGSHQAHSAHGPPAGSAVLLSQQCDTAGCVHACTVHARPLDHHTVGRVHRHPPQHHTQQSRRKLRCVRQGAGSGDARRPCTTRPSTPKVPHDRPSGKPCGTMGVEGARHMAMGPKV
jgi:hypothetical protein